MLDHIRNAPKGCSGRCCQAECLFSRGFAGSFDGSTPPYTFKNDCSPEANVLPFIPDVCEVVRRERIQSRWSIFSLVPKEVYILLYSSDPTHISFPQQSPQYARHSPQCQRSPRTPILTPLPNPYRGMVVEFQTVRSHLPSPFQVCHPRRIH